MAQPALDAIIRVRDITVQFGATRVLDGLDLDVKRGEILGFVGPSGAGKSVLTRTIIGLVPKVSGRIEVFGVDLDAADSATRRSVERRWGILFQQGALFSSLTVRQNIQFPVREYLKVSQRLLDEIMVAKLGMVGLRPEVADRFPSELSGGMVKRVALARALALDPELVFVDEPTSGLDPRSRQPLYSLRPHCRFGEREDHCRGNDGRHASLGASLAAAIFPRQARPCGGGLEHDPEEWVPIFRKDHAQTIGLSAMMVHPEVIALQVRSS